MRKEPTTSALLPRKGELRVADDSSGRKEIFFKIGFLVTESLAKKGHLGTWVERERRKKYHTLSHFSGSSAHLLKLRPSHLENWCGYLGNTHTQRERRIQFNAPHHSTTTSTQAAEEEGGGGTLPGGESWCTRQRVMGERLVNQRRK